MFGLHKKHKQMNTHTVQWFKKYIGLDDSETGGMDDPADGEENVSICILCRNHCPLDAPKCSRGQ